MANQSEFVYEADTTQPMSSEVVTAIAKAHNEDVLDQKWQISDDINPDALDGLFRDQQLDTTLKFEADAATITIIADSEGDSIIRVVSHR